MRILQQKKCVNFGIKLDAEISIWMQSRFDGFDFSATLLLQNTKVFGHRVHDGKVPPPDHIVTSLGKANIFIDIFFSPY